MIPFPSHHWLHSLNAFQRIAFFRSQFWFGGDWHIKTNNKHDEETKWKKNKNKQQQRHRARQFFQSQINTYAYTNVAYSNAKTITIIFIADIFTFSMFVFFSFACLFSAKLNFAPIAFSHCLWIFLYRCCCCWFFFCNGKKRQHQLNWNDLIGFFFLLFASFFSVWVCVLCLSRLKPLSLSVSFPNSKAKNYVTGRWQRENGATDDKCVCVIKTHRNVSVDVENFMLNYML